jgi:cell wall-associated NlpC family hydrolase
VTVALVALVVMSLGLTRPTAARAAVTTKAAVDARAAVTNRAAVTTRAAVAATASRKRKAMERSAWRYAMRQRGKPYVWGGTGPYGFDCSGLVYASYRSDGVRLPRTTFDMLNSGRLVWVPKSKAHRGDLAFFGSGHVELYDHGNWTYGAADAGSRIGFHHMNSFWHPTMYFRVR